jgi:hypothetical protein
LQIAVHPDGFQTPDFKVRAEAAFKKVGAMYAELESPHPAAKKIAIANWIVDGPLCAGDSSDLYLVHGETAPTGILKIVRNARDNWRIAAEVAALNALLKQKAYYAPQVLQTFEASGRSAVVETYTDGFLSLHEIVRRLSPKKLDFRHVVWMGNRAFSLLEQLEYLGIVHGSITPDHLMYHPFGHGLRLVGWGASVECDGKHRVKTVQNDWRSLYPKNLMMKRPAEHTLDVFMLMKSLMAAVWPRDVPKRFTGLIEYCTAESPSARPAAWLAGDIWRRLAKDEYGDPTYVKLDLPPKR